MQWYITLVHRSGTSHWYITVVHHSGTSQWYITVVHRSGTSQWYITVVHRSGTSQWYITVVHRSGTSQWYIAVVHRSGTSQWYITVLTAVTTVGCNTAWIHSAGRTDPQTVCRFELVFAFYRIPSFPSCCCSFLSVSISLCASDCLCVVPMPRSPACESE